MIDFNNIEKEELEIMYNKLQRKYNKLQTKYTINILLNGYFYLMYMILPFY